MQFVDVKSDIAFKKVFGNESKKEILISFLNAILDLRGEMEIGDLTILNPWQAPRIAALKETVLDIHAVNKKGTTFIVEIQVQKKLGFEKRVLYYTSKAYASQLKKADDYPMLNQVIFIGILDFTVFEGDGYLTRHLILNTSTYRQELSDMEFNFVELPKFKKGEEELLSTVDKWIYFIKHAGELTMVPVSANFVELQEAYDVANKMGWSEHDIELYDYWLMRLQDQRGEVEYSFLEGQRKGLTEGRREGKEEGLAEGQRKGKEEGLAEGERKGLAEGQRKGKEEGLAEGQRKGLIEGIALALEIKYGNQGLNMMDAVGRLHTVESLETLKNLIRRSTSLDDIKAYLTEIVK